MIAISHYGAQNDISGVSSWLALLLADLKTSGVPVSLHLEHFGQDGGVGSLFQQASKLGVPTGWVPRSGDTHQDVRRILEFLNQSRPSVFLPQCMPSGHYAAMLAQTHGIPWAFTLHSDDPAYWALAERCGPHPRHGIWVAVSETIASEARRRFPEADVRVIPYGVDLPQRQALWNPSRFRVVYSGRLVEEQKRVSLVIQALIGACRASSCVEAVILGDGHAREAMEESVRNEGMEHRISFPGHLGPQAVQEELLQAQAILLMSDYEGLPLCLLEAMACGVVPVARSIRSGIPEIIADGVTGFLIDSGPEQAAMKIAELADAPRKWQQVSINCNERIASGFSHAFCMRKWRELLDELTARAAPRFPIPIHHRPSLPPVDPRLGKLDRRQTPPPGWIARKLAGIRRRCSWILSRDTPS